MAIIEQALAVDSKLVRFAQAMPQQARFKPCRISSQNVEELAHKGYFHSEYPSKASARRSGALVFVRRGS
jgi:hypothetical protein